MKNGHTRRRGNSREPGNGMGSSLGRQENPLLNLVLRWDRIRWPGPLRKAFERNEESSIIAFDPALDLVFS